MSTPTVFPPPLAGIGLTLAACCATFLVTGGLIGVAGVWLALGLGFALGFGGVGTLAARTVPEPAELRLGLRGFSGRLLGLLVLLAPLSLLVSEVDNWVAEWLPRPEEGGAAEGADPRTTTLRLVELGLFSVLLRPVLEEFFFRGVVQQGAVAALGAPVGVVHQALLFALARASFGVDDPYRAATLGAQGLLEGWVLGWLRLASGSLLPGMAFQVGAGGLALLASAFADRFPIPGFTGGEAHTPVSLVLPSVVCVAAGLVWMRREWRAQPPLPPPPPPEEPESTSLF